jgi:hypothetical protein
VRFAGGPTVSAIIPVEIFNTVDDSSNILFAHAGWGALSSNVLNRSLGYENHLPI